jgi:Ca2+-binding EF-hand superfamily protein
MAEHETFVPRNVFRRMLNDDLHRKNVVPEDLYTFLLDNKNVDKEEAQVLMPSITLEQCEMMLSQYDNDRDGELSYQEFLPLIMPS